MADDEKVVVTRRAGGSWELVGTIGIVLGMFGCMADNGHTGVISGALVAGGFIVFLVGRFM